MRKVKRVPSVSVEATVNVPRWALAAAMGLGDFRGDEQARAQAWPGFVGQGP